MTQLAAPTRAVSNWTMEVGTGSARECGTLVGAPGSSGSCAKRADKRAKVRNSPTLLHVAWQLSSEWIGTSVWTLQDQSSIDVLGTAEMGSVFPAVARSCNRQRSSWQRGGKMLCIPVARVVRGAIDRS